MANGIELEDVGGSFTKFIRQAPKEMRRHIEGHIEKSGAKLAAMIKAQVHVGENAPHIRDAITYRRYGQLVLIGLLDANQPAVPGSDTTLADVAMYEEVSPNHHPYMRPTAEQFHNQFLKDMTEAIEAAEKALSI